MSIALSMVILLIFIAYTLRSHTEIYSAVQKSKNPPTVYGDPYMDKEAIEQAAIDLKNALHTWCDREEIKKNLNDTRRHWTQEKLDRIVVHEKRRIDSILERYEPIFRLAIREEINHPFNFSLYMMSSVGRVFTDELYYPQISEPYFRLCNLLGGQLSLEETYMNHYIKNNILPDKYHQVVKEIEQEISTNYTQS